MTIEAWIGVAGTLITIMVIVYKAGGLEAKLSNVQNAQERQEKMLELHSNENKDTMSALHKRIDLAIERINEHDRAIAHLQSGSSFNLHHKDGKS